MKVETFLSTLKSLQTKQHKTNQDQPNTSCKPADFRQILQFTCANNLIAITSSILTLTAVGQWEYKMV